MPRDYVLQRFSPAVNLRIDYARELNPQQHAAVTADPGPALVLAGAGAGKTRTLIYRVAFLLEQGVPADHLLLLTFTNKAAREMMQRVTSLLGGDMPGLWGGTFHSIGHRILRRHGERLGYRPNFTILDREDAADLLKACLAESGLERSDTRFPKADVLADMFSLSVNTGQRLPEIVSERYDYFLDLTPQIERLARAYQDRKRAANIMDFDDLLVLWQRLLRDHADLCRRYQEKFEFILVDEYQDTNTIQANVIDLLAGLRRNVMVVGDDSQSIYSWRGANFQNILRFPQRYPDVKIYKIETNYRSTPEILQLANAAIQANLHQFSKELAPVRRSGMKPALVTCTDGGEQAAFVAQRMLELREEGVEMKEMAVLYRSHFHCLELQMELTRRNIPFAVTSGIRFFEQAHIKDVAAYLKLVVNPADELAFKRLVRLLPGIGGKGAEKLWQAFRTASGVAQANASSDPSPPGPTAPVATAFQGCVASVPKKALLAWTELATTISQLEAPEVRDQPAELIRIILEAGYDEYLQESYANYRSRREDLEQLASFARNFSGTNEFLTQLSLLSSLDAEESTPVSRDEERVRLSTIHQAKGLEFDVVFIIMLCDGLFPNARSLETDNAEEEERRLFYVAITRARKELYLSYPLVRMSPGRGRDVMQEPSRFLAEIPRDLVDEWNLRSFHSST